jgi:hypothetical protein
MTETIHPARSPEFLSRLHDGELDLAERAAFEAHRTACAECRQAADAFAASLAVFRSSPTAPPAADLSARILRKIRAQSPSRRPFGVMFGIDIRWAGALVAALLVVLMSAPLLLRRQPAVPPPPSAIPARILDGATAQEAAREPPASAAPPSAVRPERSAARKDSSAREPIPEPATRQVLPASPEAPSADAEERKLSSPPAEAKAAAPALAQPATSLEPTGGQTSAADAADASGFPPQLSVRALDGEGPAPALASQPAEGSLAELRGQQFVVIVEAEGRVREVAPSTGDRLLSKDEAPQASARRAPRPSDALLTLRFSPGERPRRLLVRIE